MTHKNTTLSTAEKIKSFAIAIIGAGIFSMGSTYFSEQTSYRIPRILFPVYELLGNTGLAISMMILGALLMFFAYRKFTANGGKPMYLLTFLVIGILGFYGIIFAASSRPATIEDIKTSLENNEKRTQEKIAVAGRPEMDSELANAYLDKLEALKQKFEKAVKERNKATFDECEKEYEQLTKKLGNVVKEVNAQSYYSKFISYNAKMFKQIQDYRMHQWQ